MRSPEHPVCQTCPHRSTEKLSEHPLGIRCKPGTKPTRTLYFSDRDVDRKHGMLKSTDEWERCAFSNCPDGAMEIKRAAAILDGREKLTPLDTIMGKLHVDPENGMVYGYYDGKHGRVVKEGKEYYYEVRVDKTWHRQGKVDPRR